MFTGLNIYETEKYVDPWDPDKNSPTEFFLSGVDTIVKKFIEDRSSSFDTSGNLRINAGERAIWLVRLGLKDMRNFIDPRSGNAMKFDTISVSINGKNYMAVTEEIIMFIPGDLLDRIADQIDRKSKISKEEAKN